MSAADTRSPVSRVVIIGMVLVAQWHFNITANADDAFHMYVLQNTRGMKVAVINYGAIITSIVVRDREGNFADVALGYKRAAEYEQATQHHYFGAIVGRYANRIAKGAFTLDGQCYSLALNDGPNHLHGGDAGFDRVVWNAKEIQGEGWEGLELSYSAKDLEEGYPGNLHTTVIYRVTEDDTLVIEYRATTDKATPINLTQHTYFNLKGEGQGDILDHELMINAKHYTPVDSTLIPTGKVSLVNGTPFDFRSAKRIGRDIQQHHEQLSHGRGYDHNWVLSRDDNARGMKLAARVYESSSGRIVEVFTSEPAIQFYSGNVLDGSVKGKSGQPYGAHAGLCLETQHYPDSPNRPAFPSTILRPGEEYFSKTEYRFSTR